MAKIDLSSIPGYEEMTPEEKIAALEAVEVPEDTSEAYTKLKSAFDKAASDAAEWKRQFRAKQSEEERIAAERAEADAAVQAELAELRRDKQTQGFVSKFLSVGYAPELAQQAASAMVDGDTDTVFSTLSTYIEGAKKEIQIQAMNATPQVTPGSAVDPKQAEAEALRKMWGLA